MQKPVFIRCDSVHDPASDRTSRIAPRVAVSVPAAMEQRLLEILRSETEAGETIVIAFARKERAIVAELAALSVLEAYALHRRLSQPSAGDALAMQFDRLTRERRTRVLGYLADVRRRNAVRKVG